MEAGASHQNSSRETFLVDAEATRYGVDERAAAMSTPVEIRDVAPWVERLARVGYAAKALLYITIGILAAQAALARAAEQRIRREP